VALRDSVDGFFAPQGVLATQLARYVPRAGQRAMAMEVADAVEYGGQLVVEAGTGIGKTYAYLLPLLLSGRRAMVSTATKALQDQLFGRDIPAIQALLPMRVRVAALKGRSSYLCLHRLEIAQQQDAFLAEVSASLQTRLNTWAGQTVQGDIAELSGLEDDAPAVPWVTSTRDNCLGSSCPRLSRCHVNRARREAMAADLVVVNHHLFFADLQVRESGVAELLPSVGVVVFDEAHQLNDIGVQFLGQHLSTTKLKHFLRDLERLIALLGMGWEQWRRQSEVCAMRIDILVEIGKPIRGRSLWEGAAPAGINAPLWEQVMEHLCTAWVALLLGLESVAPASPELQALHARGSALLSTLGIFSGHADSDRVRWLEGGTTLRLVTAPLDIAATMEQRVLGPHAAQSARAWIFTSATLGGDPSLDWFTESCGLTPTQILRIDSPFDYAHQAALYVPKEFPHPSHATHSDAVAALVAEAAQLLGGRTLVLTTTLRAMRAISDSLNALLHGKPLRVLRQGQIPKQSLLQQLEQAVSAADGSGVVLVASASFWEGVDVAGDALQLLVIDKLPFTPPDDPVMQARAAHLQKQGGNAFKSLYLPQAAVALRQGAGRLIRQESDRGVLVVCDPRLANAGYGKQLLKVLPPMRLLGSGVEFQDALRALTTASTTERHPCGRPC